MNIFHTELKQIIKEITEFNQKERDALVAEKKNQVIKAMKDIMLLCLLARREGLLSLEEYAKEKLPKTGIESELAGGVMLIVDGTDPKYVEDIMSLRFYSGNYKAYDALAFFIYMKGVLYVQRGANPRILEEALLAMLPRELSETFAVNDETGYSWVRILTEEEEVELLGKAHEDAKAMKERFCNYTPPISYTEDGALSIMLANYVISGLDDCSMQRVLREIDNVELSQALRGMNASARTKIISNLSQRLAVMIISDTERLRWLTVEDVGKDCLHILTIIVKLFDTGEICNCFPENIKEFVQALQEMEAPQAVYQQKKSSLKDAMWKFLKEERNIKYL